MSQSGAAELKRVFGLGIFQLTSEGFPLENCQGDFCISIKPSGSGWEVRYVKQSGETKSERLLEIRGPDNSTTSTMQPGSRLIDAAFEVGIAELAKEGAPLGRGQFNISIRPSGSGSVMNFGLIPKKMSGDRLLFIQNQYVQLVPLF